MTSTPATTIGPWAPGALHAAINLGNAVLASRNSDTAEPRGITVDMATEIARRLGVAIELVPVASARAAVDLVSCGAVHIGFFAHDPLRSAGVTFSEPYLLLQGAYITSQPEKFRTPEDVDVAGQSIAVSRNSAYDLYLSRELKAARILHVDSGAAVLDAVQSGKALVGAGVRQYLEQSLPRYPGLVILDKNFMVIEQCVGISNTLGPQAARTISAIVEDLKDNYVAASATTHGQNITVPKPHRAKEI